MSRWRRSSAPRGADYDQRWADLAAAGVSVHGEADLVTSFAPRNVLDAGCGTGRVAIELARRGIEAVGVDADPAMLDRAREKAPDLRWIEADLATVSARPPDRYDCVVMAGNVMIFVAPGSAGAVVANMAGHTAPGGIVIAGFEVGRLTLDRYDELAAASGLVLAERWSTWDRMPFVGGDYAVSVHRRPTDAAGEARTWS